MSDQHAPLERDVSVKHRDRGSLEVRVLGVLQVTVGSQPVELPAAKVRAIVAMLALHPGQVLSSERLVEGLWGDAPPPSASNTLQGYVSQLRRRLGPGSIVTRSPGYLLAVSPEATDAGRLERLLAQGRAALRSGLATQAVELIEEALGEWGGSALEEFANESFFQAEAARLEELRLLASEELAEARLALGDHRDLVGHLRSLVEEHPFRERLWGQLILALYRCGRQAEALRAFSELRQRLAEELGIEPSIDLRRLEHAILIQDPALDSTHPPSVDHAPSVTPNNLPRSRSSFVGRQKDLNELDALLREPGLVTVVGPGGVGKTRLAVEAALRSRDRYSDGAWLVELAALVEPSLVVKATASVFGIQEEPGQPLLSTLLRELVAQRSLVVLDNCEHLVEAAASLVETLLAASDSLTVLATSREPLRLEGEVVWRARPLPLPPGEITSVEGVLDSDAVRLFCERSKAHGRFAVGADNAAAVASVCRRLDGIPLAIELAAARSGALSPAQMLARLDDRFAFLTQGRRTALPRHQTLEAAMEWSYGLLTPSEQALFRRLAVFAGSFTIDAASEVCAYDGLEALVEKSLVVARDDERYELLESLREFGAERLAESGEEETVHRQHADFYLDLAVEANLLLRGPQEQATLEMMEREHDNFRAALSWLLRSGEGGRGLRFATSLARFWSVRGHWAEGREWLDKAIAVDRGTGDASLLAYALTAAGRLACSLADVTVAERHFSEALSLARDGQDEIGAAMALSGMGVLAYTLGREDQSRRWHEESIRAWRAAGAETGILASLYEALQSLGVLAYHRGDLEAATRYFEECLAAGKEFGDAAKIGALTGLGAIAQAQGNSVAAREMYERVLTIARAFGYRRWIATSLAQLGRVAMEQREADRAKALYAESLGAAGALNDRRAIASVLEDMAKLAQSEGEIEHAAILVGAASGLREAIAVPIEASESASYEQCVTAIRVQLDTELFDRLTTRGRDLPPRALIEFACRGEAH